MPSFIAIKSSNIPCTKTQKPRSKSPGPPDQEISGHALGEQIFTSRGTRTSPQLMFLQIFDTLQTTLIIYEILVTYRKYAEDSNWNPRMESEIWWSIPYFASCHCVVKHELHFSCAFLIYLMIFLFQTCLFCLIFLSFGDPVKFLAYIVHSPTHIFCPVRIFPFLPGVAGCRPLARCGPLPSKRLYNMPSCVIIHWRAKMCTWWSITKLTQCALQT